LGRLSLIPLADVRRSTTIIPLLTIGDTFRIVDNLHN
jgi:hypothetical protein